MVIILPGVENFIKPTGLATYNRRILQPLIDITKSVLPSYLTGMNC